MSTRDLIAEMTENVNKYGRETMTTYLMVQAIKELQRLVTVEAALLAQVEALSSGNERQASKIEKLAGDLKAREADICKDRASLRVIYDYQRGERWYWQGDGQDHLDSMADLLPIVIRAEQLRALIAKPTHSLPTRPVVPKECAPTDCDAWFASLPQGRQWALREDKWTLARAAFDAGRAAAPQAEATKRPQNCGTGFCSCIECVVPDSQKGGA